MRRPAGNGRTGRNAARQARSRQQAVSTTEETGVDVSVIMPVYNAASYIAEAVQSVLGQTFQDFEFIIIDDGSTDASNGILRNFAARDPRIQLISRPNT